MKSFPRTFPIPNTAVRPNTRTSKPLLLSLLVTKRASSYILHLQFFSFVKKMNVFGIICHEQ